MQLLYGCFAYLESPKKILFKEPQRSRVWYDYYYDPTNPAEDPKEGADAEELELASDEEEEVRQAAEAVVAHVQGAPDPEVAHGSRQRGELVTLQC